jgi:hypothetical protein
MRAADSAPIDPPPGSLDRAGDTLPVPSGAVRLWTLVLAAGMLAGLAAGIAGELCVSAFRPRRHAVNSEGVAPRVIQRRAEAAADAKNAGLAFAILGAASGAALGAAGGFLRGSNRAAGRAAVLGLAAGALGGVGASAIALPAYNAYKLGHPDEASASLTLALLVQAGVGSVIGAAAGLAFGRGLGVRGVPWQAIAGGIVGAVLGATAVVMLGAMTFPEGDITRFMSTDRRARVLAKLAVAILVAVGTGFSVGGRESRSATPAA